MSKLLFALFFLSFSVASSIWWFERVSNELSNTHGLSNVTYRPGTWTDSTFTFDRNGKKISVWARFSVGNNAVYAFDSEDGTPYRFLRPKQAL